MKQPLVITREMVMRRGLELARMTDDRDLYQRIMSVTVDAVIRDMGGNPDHPTCEQLKAVFDLIAELEAANAQ